MPPTAPTTEQGSADLRNPIPGWSELTSAIFDDREYAPDVQWPASVRTYERMETDAQVRGLLLGMFLPLRRFRWSLDPNGASDEVVEHMARDFGLPIRGEDAPPPVPRSEQRNRFNHDRHLAHTLRALVYGHYFFEQVGTIGDDDKWHLRKLAPRPPFTIAEGGSIEVAPDGGLIGIKQGGWMLRGQKMIGADRLVAYVWDQEGANWFGRSMLRAAFKNWAIKDNLLRVDATNHARNGAGVPWFEVDDSLGQREIDKLARTAQKIRAGDTAGGAGPGKLSIKGVEGSLPDTIKSVEYHDKQMSMATLELFSDLGRNTDRGTQSLGGSLLDFFSYAQEAVAGWHAEITTEHAIWDAIDWSYGIDESAPKLVYDRSAEEDLAISDLVLLVDKGVVAVDSEIEAAVRERYNLPVKPEVAEQVPTGQSFAYDLEDGIVTIDERRAQIGLPPREDGLGSLTVPEYLAQFGGNVETALQASARLWERRRPPATAAASSVKVGHREPLEHELRAATDFEAMQAEFVSERDQLVADVRETQAEQVAELQAQVEDANGDLEALAVIAATPVAATVIAESAKRVARGGVDQVTAEAAAQGVTASAPELAVIDEALEARAAAVDRALADALSQAAKSKALQLSGAALTPNQVATQVALHLQNLSDAYLAEQLGGLVTQAQNTGRRETMRANPPTTVLASELLDENTCSVCAEYDGREYASVEEAENDYTVGGNNGCEGGVRCRGTVVALWD